MGIIKDIIEKRAMEIVNNKITSESNDTTEHDITKYNRIWLNKIANKTGFVISDNEKKVDNILKALNKRDGHCPCGGMTKDFICPCKMMREYNECKCGLYLSARDIEPKDAKSTGKIKE